MLTAGTLEELVGLGTLTGQAARFLEAAVVAGLNIIVEGGRGPATRQVVDATSRCFAASGYTAHADAESEGHEADGGGPRVGPPGTFSFRQRFELAPGGRLPFQAERVVLSQADTVLVELTSLEDKPLSESSLLAIWGSGYESEGSAKAAGGQWRQGMQKALAAVKLGANFGLRNPHSGGLTDYMIDKIKRETGVVVHRDSWDVLVFPSEPRPLFSSLSAEANLVRRTRMRLWRQPRPA